MNVTIDGKLLAIFDDDMNIVDVADREKIALPAPCYRNDRLKGCCRVCVVEIDGEIRYACMTKPVDGMNIILDRDDLNDIRRKNAREYSELPDNAASTCDCRCQCATTDCC